MSSEPLKAVFDQSRLRWFVRRNKLTTEAGPFRFKGSAERWIEAYEEGYSEGYDDADHLNDDVLTAAKEVAIAAAIVEHCPSQQFRLDEATSKLLAAVRIHFREEIPA